MAGGDPILSILRSGATRVPNAAQAHAQQAHTQGNASSKISCCCFAVFISSYILLPVSQAMHHAPMEEGIDTLVSYTGLKPLLRQTYGLVLILPESGVIHPAYLWDTGDKIASTPPPILPSPKTSLRNSLATQPGPNKP